MTQDIGYQMDVRNKIHVISIDLLILRGAFFYFEKTTIYQRATVKVAPTIFGHITISEL